MKYILLIIALLFAFGFVEFLNRGIKKDADKTKGRVCKMIAKQHEEQLLRFKNANRDEGEL